MPSQAPTAEDPCAVRVGPRQVLGHGLPTRIDSTEFEASTSSTPSRARRRSSRGGAARARRVEPWRLAEGKAAGSGISPLEFEF